MKDNVNVFAPASSANLGCGFDSIGLALTNIGDILKLKRNKQHTLRIFNKTKARIPTSAEKNISTIVMQKMLDKLNINDGFDVFFLQKIKPSGGLGSSSASAVAAVFGLNYLLGNIYSKKKLIYFATLGEEIINGAFHADNTAPSMLGGVQFISKNNPLTIYNLPYPESLICILLSPNVEVNTQKARKILSKNNSFKEAICVQRHFGLLINGFYTQNIEQIGKAMQFSLVDKLRMNSIPAYKEIKSSAIQNGALGFCISGSGPSVLAITNTKEKANDIAKSYQKIYKTLNIKHAIFISKIDAKGARMIKIGRAHV